MAATTLESIQPYVEQLFDDSDVQKHLARATANLRGARSRAGNAKSKKKALQDPTAAPAAGQHRAGGGRGRRRDPEGAGEEGAPQPPQLARRARGGRRRRVRGDQRGGAHEAARPRSAQNAETSRRPHERRKGDRHGRTRATAPELSRRRLGVRARQGALRADEPARPAGDGARQGRAVREGQAGRHRRGPVRRRRRVRALRPRRAHGHDHRRAEPRDGHLARRADRDRRCGPRSRASWRSSARAASRRAPRRFPSRASRA